MELRFPCINPSIWCIYTWWRHQMETFSALLAICAGNSPVPGNSPHKVQWRGALMFSLICAWISGWVNNREAGDLRRNHAHYDIIVMIKPFGGKSVLWRDCIGLRNLLSKVHSHLVRGICCITWTWSKIFPGQFWLSARDLTPINFQWYVIIMKLLVMSHELNGDGGLGPLRHS